MTVKQLLAIFLIGTIIIALIFFLDGCASSKQISSSSEETTTVQAISVPVPAVHDFLTMIPLQPDSVSPWPYGTYYKTDIATGKDPFTGKVYTAQVTNKITVKKDILGKPVVTSDITVTQNPITTQAQVIEKKTSTTQTTTYTSFFDKIKWWLLGFVLLIAGAFILLKKFFPAALTIISKGAL
jgi:hypothetical protein